MPYTQEYSDKIDSAYKATQEEDGMTNENVSVLQELLQYYPENKDLRIDGQYGDATVKAVNSFFDNYYWTPERRLEEAKDRYGEKYIMQSEMDAMMEAAPDTTDKREY
jgi:hypothetical protein